MYVCSLCMYVEHTARLSNETSYARTSQQTHLRYGAGAPKRMQQTA
jgi:hypothetical protein